MISESAENTQIKFIQANVPIGARNRWRGRQNQAEYGNYPGGRRAGTVEYGSQSIDTVSSGTISIEFRAGLTGGHYP